MSLEKILKDSLGKKVGIHFGDTNNGDGFTVEGTLEVVEDEYLLIEGAVYKIYVNRKTTYIQTLSVLP